MIYCMLVQYLVFLLCTYEVTSPYHPDDVRCRWCARLLILRVVEESYQLVCTRVELIGAP